MKITNLILSNFPQIIQADLTHLSQDDYSVLDTFKFVSIWWSAIADLVEDVKAMQRAIVIQIADRLRQVTVD